MSRVRYNQYGSNKKGRSLDAQEKSAFGALARQQNLLGVRAIQSVIFLPAFPIRCI